MNAVQKWKKANPEAYAKLVAAAGGRCCLCRKKFSRTRLLALDHRHYDGLVRGVPCSPCNERLGINHDDAGWFARAAAYLDSPPAVDVIGVHYVPGSLGAALQKELSP
jgi:hypothetical protein